MGEIEDEVCEIFFDEVTIKAKFENIELPKIQKKMIKNSYATKMTKEGLDE